MLAAILLPALSQARERARQATCLNNLKQLGLGFMMYLQDNGEYFPLQSSDPNDLVNIYQYNVKPNNWAWAIERYVRGKTWTDFDSDIGVSLHKYILVERFMTARSNPFRCPKEIAFSTWVTEDKASCSYWGNRLLLTPDWGPNRNRRLSEVRKDNSKVVLLYEWGLRRDEQSKDIARAGVNCFWKGPGEMYPPRHSSGMNVLFVDGHAQWVKNKYMNSTDPNFYATTDENGFTFERN
ncbi:MAG: DUF1559 domain-containing protein [bacterium]|nr:DUF1559 domain-containing protein [bacterium]